MNRFDESDADRPPLKEELVAYLDGELDAETARDLENLLATDPAAREEMHRMEQAWDLLDQLPRADVDEAFTHSTIEMVALSAAEEVELQQTSLPSQRRRQLLVGVGSLLAAVAIGFFSVYTFWPNPNAQLLQDLPVLERLDQYRQVQSIDFLRELNAQNLLTTSSSSPVAGGEPTSLTERQMLVEQMEPADKEALLRKQQRFNELPASEQQRIRGLHAEIQADPQSAALRGVLSAYYDWLLQQSPSQRAGLAALETEGRIERIEKLRQEEQQRELQRVSPEDLDAIADWIEEQLRERLPAGEVPAVPRGLTTVERRGALMLFASARMPSIMGAAPLNAAAWQSLRQSLSPAGQAKFDQLETDEQRRRVLWSGWDGWIHQSIRHSIARYYDSLLADVDKDELVRFFEELPAGERNDLQRIPSGWRESRLRSMYVRKHKADQIPKFARDIKSEWGSRGSGRGEGRWPGREGFSPGPARRGPGGGPGQNN